MSAVVFLYALVLVLVALGLWGAYRVLGTPTRLAPADYSVVLKDIALSAQRAGQRLRAAALAGEPDPRALEDVATSTRKIFQTGYYQTLRLRPAAGPDATAPLRESLGRACEAYDWASRMLGSESGKNPIIFAEAVRLLDAGDAGVSASLEALSPPASEASESTQPSP